MRVWVVGVEVLAGVVGVTGCAGEVKRPDAVDVSVSHCGQGWARPHAGQQELAVHNSGDVAAEAYVVEVGSGAVYGELENLAPGTTRAMTVTLGGGTFAMRCVPDGADPIMGPRVTISGAPRKDAAVLPVADGDLYGPVRAYQAYVAKGLDELASRTASLKASVDSGNVQEAKTAWLPAHLAYEQLGAAYGAFGDLDKKINGRPDGLPGGVGDQGFTGFHRVEYGLWHGEGTASLKKATDQLVSDVKALRDGFPHMQVEPGSLGLRAHEILEGTLRFELSGASDQGSGTGLATATANVAGTREVLDLLRPLLKSRFAGLPQVDAGLDKLDKALAAQQHNGTWTPVDQLTTSDRQRLDAITGDLLERLAPVAAILAPRRTS